MHQLDLFEWRPLPEVKYHQQYLLDMDGIRVEQAERDMDDYHDAILQNRLAYAAAQSVVAHFDKNS
jgi:hypothetical protein